MRGASGIADLARNIARGIGHDRQFSAQLIHIFECSGADTCNRFYLRAVVVDHCRHAFGILRQPLAGDPPERFQVARLRGDEIACEAQFAVNRDKAGFRVGRFLRAEPARHRRNARLRAGSIALRAATGPRPAAPAPPIGLSTALPSSGVRPSTSSPWCAKPKNAVQPATAESASAGRIQPRLRGRILHPPHTLLPARKRVLPRFRRFRFAAARGFPPGRPRRYSGPRSFPEDNTDRVTINPRLTLLGLSACHGL